jgi:hypothetical protein
MTPIGLAYVQSHLSHGSVSAPGKRVQDLYDMTGTALGRALGE